MADLNVKFADLAPRRRCKLLCGLVVPRPIALVSSLSGRRGQCGALLVLQRLIPRARH